MTRGEIVIDTQHPLQVPVGDRLLGRMLNLFGEAEILKTGIKVIDLLTPLERGGKTGLLGSAGVGKTVLIDEREKTARSVLEKLEQ